MRVGFAFALFFLLLAVASPAWAGGETCAYAPAPGAAAPSLRAGINVTDWLKNWKGESPFAPGQADAVARLGFTFVRLPVGPKHLEVGSVQTQEAILRALHCDLARLLNAGLVVVLDLHPPVSFHEALAALSPQARLERLVALWKVLGRATEGLPADRIYFQLLNEPTEKEENWWTVQGRLVEALRPLFPDHPFIVSAYYTSYRSLYKQTPYADPNLFYDFHFYEPSFFTHHGAPWDTRAAPQERGDLADYPVVPGRGVANYSRMKTYLAEGWDKEKLWEKIEPNVAWAKKYKVRLLCLEFGVFRTHVTLSGRVRWLEDVRSLLEKAGIPWALWNYDGDDDFDLIGPSGGVDRPMLRALGL